MTDGEIQYLEQKAAQFRALANEHQAAGHDTITRKLAEVADELAAKAAELRTERRFSENQRTEMKYHRPDAPNQAASDLRSRAAQCRAMAMAALDPEYFREMWEYADVLDQKADEVDDASLSPAIRLKA